MKKKIIIIGAGISGLSAGCYGQMNGYETEIFEMQNTPGGLCTSWNRNGYLIDGCIDWLIGLNPDDFIYDFWKELGVFDNTEFIHHDYMMQVEGMGKHLVLYSDADKLQKHLLELSPDDSSLIKEFTEAIKDSAFFSKTTKPIFNKKFACMTMYDFINQFKDPFLREALGVCLLPLDSREYCVGGLIFRLSFYNRKDAGWPVGGSLEFAKKIENKYKVLGGKVNYRAEVSEIIVNENKAVGVKLKDGSEHYADCVISAIDTHRVLFDLLKGKYVNNEIKNLYNNEKALHTSMQVSVGINCDLSCEPHSLAIKLEDPITIGDTVNEYLYLKHFCFDKIISNKSKSVITSIIKTDYEYWSKLYKKPCEYKAEKERICREFIIVIEKRFPEIKGKIEVTDVVTPVTYNRYAGVWRGSYLGWSGSGIKAIDLSVVHELKNFYMAGQWIKPSGGVSAAMMAGRECISKMCMQINGA
ncbi:MULTISPECIES: phytoene desaturase family protein [Clostridium]|uniref:phytoene desaturase family protein n=1 Tax=Clostridium TaxID=1485 RepID=UPI000824C659|nr:MULTISPECIES: FAD-dependent oxidoreductase [Clostridium]PJI06812.1 NAD(P)/FAD-dependent oxidoreductase [Clostridium sp. CT7]